MTSHIKNISTVLLVFFFALLASNCAKDSDLFYELSQYEEEQEIVYEDEATDEQSENEESSEEEVESNPAPEETSSDETDVEVPNPDFTYSSMQDAFNNASLWQDAAIVKIEGLQGGSFTYYANTSTSSDGGLILDVPNRSGKLARIWNNNGVVKAEWYGMIPNNDNIDNRDYFQRIINAHLQGNVDKILFEGSYNFNTTAKLDYAENLTLQGTGSGRATFYSNYIHRILVTNNPTKNITISNIKFQSNVDNWISEQTANNAAILYWESTTADGIYIDNCEFTAPKIMSNGMKIWVETDDVVTNVRISNSYFHDTGRMGFETVNHQGPLAAERIKNVVFENNVVERTGLITNPNSHGMGVSFSGRNVNVSIRNNKFTDHTDCAIEIIGNYNTEIINNEMNGIGSPVHIVRLYTSSGTIVNDQITLKGNIANTYDGSSFINATNVVSEDNVWNTSKRVFVQGVSNFIVNNDIYRVSEIAVFQIFGSEIRNNTGIQFENTQLIANNQIPIFSFTASNGRIDPISVNCSKLEIPTGSYFDDGNYVIYGNVEKISAGKLLNIELPSYNKCLPLP